jgi:hypothetical protein
VPATLLASIGQPMLWANGSVDRQVPTTVNAEILRGLHHTNWEIETLPGVDHGLFENSSGLEPNEAQATRLASGLRDLIAAWLGRTVAISPSIALSRASSWGPADGGPFRTACAPRVPG